MTGQFAGFCLAFVVLLLGMGKYQFATAAVPASLCLVYFFEKFRPRAEGEWRPRTEVSLRFLGAAIACEGLHTIGINAFPTSVNTFLENAVKEAKLSDFGSESFLPMLRAVLDDAADMPVFCRTFTALTVEHLVRRLYIVDYFSKHPEVAQIPIESPVFIVGLPRTGSTFLHNLMASHPNGRAFMHYEWRYPTPEYGTRAERLAKGQAQRKLVKTMTPNLARYHLCEADEADECHNGWIDMSHAEIGPASGMMAMPRSTSMYRSSPMTEQYQNQKRVMQTIMHQDKAGAPTLCILKNPLHTEKISTISKVFPGTVFVWTHRDLIQVYTSYYTGYKWLQAWGGHSSVSLPECGRRALTALQGYLTTSLRQREKLEKKGVVFFDLHYEELMADKVGTVQKISEATGLGWSAAAAAAVQNYCDVSTEARKKSSKKPLRSSFEETGMRREDVFEALRNYWTRFPRYGPM